MYGGDSSIKRISGDVISQSVAMFSQVIYDGSPHVIILAYFRSYSSETHHLARGKHYLLDNQLIIMDTVSIVFNSLLGKCDCWMNIVGWPSNLTWLINFQSWFSLHSQVTSEIARVLIGIMTSPASITLSRDVLLEKFSSRFGKDYTEKSAWMPSSCGLVVRWDARQGCWCTDSPFVCILVLYF